MPVNSDENFEKALSLTSHALDEFWHGYLFCLITENSSFHTIYIPILNIGIDKLEFQIRGLYNYSGLDDFRRLKIKIQLESTKETMSRMITDHQIHFYLHGTFRKDKKSGLLTEIKFSQLGVDGNGFSKEMIIYDRTKHIKRDIHVI